MKIKISKQGLKRLNDAVMAYKNSNGNRKLA